MYEMKMTCLSVGPVYVLLCIGIPHQPSPQGQFLDCCYSAAPAKPAAVAVGRDQWCIVGFGDCLGHGLATKVRNLSIFFENGWHDHIIMSAILIAEKWVNCFFFSGINEALFLLGTSIL